MINKKVATTQEESLEMKFAQIEEIIQRMEEQNVSLDESFRLYQAGIRQLKYCNEMLDSVEKQMQILNANGELRDF